MKTSAVSEIVPVEVANLFLTQEGFRGKYELVRR